MSRHLKRLAMPDTWKIKKHGAVYSAKGLPSSHPKDEAIPLSLVIRDMLSLASSKREARKVLQYNTIMIDGRRRTDSSSQLGLMSILSMKETNSHWILLLNAHGKLTLVPIKEQEAKRKICKIIGKKKLKGKKMQLNLNDGKNNLVEKDSKDSYRPGDSIMVSIPDYALQEHLPLQKGASIFLIRGKHKGSSGIIIDMVQNLLMFKKSNGETGETLKEYVMVIGKEKPLITLPA